MKIKQIFKKSLKVKIPKNLIILLSFVFVLAAIYPSDMNNFYKIDRSVNAPTFVHITENQGRFINTAIHIALPILLRDAVGLAQAINVGIATTVSTHTLKRVLNDVHIGDTRLGQRPHSPNSSKNMPSGHSSMAACSVYFIARRYGFKWLFILLPVMFLTMYARFMLDAHTISATIAGASIGMISAAFFTSKYEINQKYSYFFGFYEFITKLTNSFFKTLVSFFSLRKIAISFLTLSLIGISAYALDEKECDNLNEFKGANIKIEGKIENMPKVGFDGILIVDSLHVMVDKNTIVQKYNKKLTKGTYIEVIGKRTPLGVKALQVRYDGLFY